MTRDQVLAEMDRQHARLAKLLVGVPEPSLTAPGPDDGWSIQDLLWHLADWQEHEVGLLAGTGHRRGISTQAEMDAYNARNVADGRARWLADVRAALDRSHRGLRAQVEALDDARLAAVPPWSPGADHALWQHVAGNSFEHYQEHIATIEARLD